MTLSETKKWRSRTPKITQSDPLGHTKRGPPPSNAHVNKRTEKQHNGSDLTTTVLIYLDCFPSQLFQMARAARGFQNASWLKAWNAWDAMVAEVRTRYEKAHACNHTNRGVCTGKALFECDH